MGCDSNNFTRTHEPLLGFVIAGVQKAGTSALHSLLRSHEQIFMPQKKELHFFDTELGINWRSPNYNNLEVYFEEAPADCICGEATPIYTFWPQCLERMHSYNPKLRVIVCLRNPIDRAHSHWFMEYNRNSETLPFSEAIRKGRERVTDSFNSNTKNNRVFSYVERSIYSPQVREILNFFESHQVLFVLYENFLKDYTEILDRICDFLNVSRFKKYPKNEIISPINTAKTRGAITKEDRAFLADLFSSDIEQTAKLTGLDLSHWLE
jgi:hypothetical protein